MTNQEALDYLCKDKCPYYDHCELNKITCKQKETLQQAIDDLERTEKDFKKEQEKFNNYVKEFGNTTKEYNKTISKIDYELQLYKKALDYTCQNNVCFKDECDKSKSHLSCNECRKKYVLEQARKELENEKL